MQGCLLCEMRNTKLSKSSIYNSTLKILEMKASQCRLNILKVTPKLTFLAHGWTPQIILSEKHFLPYLWIPMNNFSHKSLTLLSSTTYPCEGMQHPVKAKTSCLWPKPADKIPLTDPLCHQLLDPLPASQTETWISQFWPKVNRHQKAHVKVCQQNIFTVFNRWLNWNIMA